MKKFMSIKNIGIILLSGMLFTGCESYLDEENFTSTTIETARTSADTFDQLVARVYEVSREYSTHYTSDLYYQLEDLGTDIVTRGNQVSGTSDINDYVNFNSTNWAVGVYWANQYAIISAANTLLSNADAIADVDENTKTVGIGEAKFFRAMSYFNLVENYGGVPLVLDLVTTPMKAFERETEETVYEQIVADLQDALSDVPETVDEYGRVTKDAVRHLMSKVLLTKGYKSFGSSQDFTNAATLAETVIANHQLVGTFDELVSIDNQRNSEVVFAYLFGNNSVSRGWGNSRHMMYKFRFFDYPGLSRSVKGLGPMPTPFYYSLFQEDDERANATFSRVLYATEDFDVTSDDQHFYGTVGDTAVYFPKEAWAEAEVKAARYHVINPDEYLTPDGVTTVHYPMFTKFDDPDVPFTQPDQSSQGERDMVIMRSGEAYLIAAEAYLKASQADKAAQLLTQLRSRAGIETAVAESEVSLDFILDERARELTGEVSRWMDLKRTGKLIERVLAHNPHAALNNAIKEMHLVRPIPQRDIDLSNGTIIQNPDYN
nr:RagB/SusD family nutrient uptake outer membrane protein [uncultured Carboxylicivirga sp.]